MKITMNSWKWNNGKKCKDCEIDVSIVEFKDDNELVIRKSDNMEQILRVNYKEFRRAVNALKEK